MQDPAEIQPARSWGLSASRLIEVLDRGHHKVKLAAEEMERLVTWIDLNAPSYPVYETAFPHGTVGRSPLTAAQAARIRELTGVNLGGGAGFGKHHVRARQFRPA